jgi:Heterokaryon incompatibility protein (HET)
VDYSTNRVHKFMTSHEIDMAMQRPYEYRRLGETGQGTIGDTDIRLLTLSPIPSVNLRTVEGTLEHVRLSTLASHEPFDAISYVWGPPAFNHTLICSDGAGHLTITERLYRILVKLRKMGGRRFWIDAVCINQNDIVERSSQVSRMSTIYRRAARVHAFLATDRELSLPEYLQSEWFTRRWVVQEAIAARELIAHKDFSVGSHTDWETVLSVIQKGLDGSESTRDIQNAATCVEIESTRKKRWSGILSLLLKFSATKCGDDTDRLFALLSIASDVLNPTTTPTTPTPSFAGSGFANVMIKFTPDYSISTSKAYKTFAIAALEAAYPFDLLHCAGAFRFHSYNEGSLLDDQDPLPSWVPDWRLIPLFKPLLKASQCEAGIAGKKRQIIEITDKHLTIAGISMGKGFGPLGSLSIR